MTQGKKETLEGPRDKQSVRYSNKHKQKQTDNIGADIEVNI